MLLDTLDKDAQRMSKASTSHKPSQRLKSSGEKVKIHRKTGSFHLRQHRRDMKWVISLRHILYVQHMCPTHNAMK